MEQFIKDNKLIIPENEIDNIYVWTQISKTQEVLLSSKVYYQLVEASFNEEAKRVISVLKSYKPTMSENMYKFCDFVTFEANKHRIFLTNRFCFAYMVDTNMLNSLICYMAHNLQLYSPEDSSITQLIEDKFDNKDLYQKRLDADFLILRVATNLGNHKYKSVILDAIMSRRSVANKFTLIQVTNKSMLIGNDIISEDLAKDKGLTDLTPMVESFNNRRKSSYQSILSIWYRMQKDISNLVYSKTEPEIRKRQVKR